MSQVAVFIKSGSECVHIKRNCTFMLYVKQTTKLLLNYSTRDLCKIVNSVFSASLNFSKIFGLFEKLTVETSAIPTTLYTIAIFDIRSLKLFESLFSAVAV